MNYLPVCTLMVKVEFKFGRWGVADSRACAPTSEVSLRVSYLNFPSEDPQKASGFLVQG